MSVSVYSKRLNMRLRDYLAPPKFPCVQLACQKSSETKSHLYCMSMKYFIITYNVIAVHERRTFRKENGEETILIVYNFSRGYYFVQNKGRYFVQNKNLFFLYVVPNFEK